MRICTRKSDNRIIEAQSGDLNPQTLIDNAVLAGYLPSDISIQIVPDQQGVALIKTQAAADLAAIPPTKDQIDATAAHADVAISAIKAMTPAQARAWVALNVNTLADAKSLLGTMAAMLCVLARRL